MKKLPLYGRSIFHLTGVLFCYALAAYAGVRLIDDITPFVLLAFPAGIVLHDFVLLPLYSSVDLKMKAQQRRTQKKRSPLWINYLRFPLIVSALLLLLYFPIILRLSENRHLFTSLSTEPYLYRWLLVTVVFLGVAALRYFYKKRKK